MAYIGAQHLMIYLANYETTNISPHTLHSPEQLPGSSHHIVLTGS